MTLKGYKKLTILHTESSKGWGGQEIRILQEALGMRDRGYRVLIATEKDSTLFNKAMQKGIEVFDIHFSKYNPYSFLKIKDLLEKEKVDILNTHSSKDSWVASIAAKMSKNKPKIIRTRHLSTPISKSYISKIIYDLIPDAIVTTSEEIKDTMIKFNRFNEKKIFSIPTGIDLKLFKNENIESAIKEQGFKIGTIGILRDWKGHSYFIESIPLIKKAIPKAIFFIIGDGPQRDNLKKLIDELDLNQSVKMLGFRDDIPKVIYSLDVIVHPSYANEGVPQVILQALAMKKPVVASNITGIREVIIDNQTGLLVEPKNKWDIAEKVIELYNNKDLRIRLGEEGEKFVKINFSIESMLDKLESIYHKLFSDSKSLIVN
ncbi:glycosyltransferase family 4 protein [Thermodesulfovibrio yellowstonii]|uniref:Glycosyl transferase group 1 n=1 Tax=Thermodesulfovibrio yellowstonii TaxID=28262 RepID=A0A9W6GF84_9BACT|nr:glycosyltransferase family 4 protein [Thermodesulfovibrio islandicus]GLI54204.1 glycosyl transferase group 1 [Thermodesulfovibrio islandicus]